MPRIIAVLLIAIITALAFPAVALAPQSLQQTHTQNLIIDNITADYALYTSLLNQTYSFKQYQILSCVDNPAAAVQYLAPGFSLSLAQSLVDYYLLWVPEVEKMAVIPTDSIPVITNEDKPYINIRRISPDDVVLERIYTNCYVLGDRYLYRITAHQEQSRWKIVDLYLEPFPDRSKAIDADNADLSSADGR